MIVIKKDYSGITYGFQVQDKDGKPILDGDGYESPKEIIDYFVEETSAVLEKSISEEEIVFSIKEE